MQALPMLAAGLGATSTLGMVSAGLGVFSSLAAGSYQAQVAKRNSEIALQNAARATASAAASAQMQDQEALVEMGALAAAGGASGLSLGVGSSALRRRSLQELAARDRGLTIYQGETEAAAYRQQAAGYESDAGAAVFGGIMGAAGSALGAFDAPSMVAGASSVSPSAAARVNPPATYVPPKPKLPKAHHGGSF